MQRLSTSLQAFLVHMEQQRRMRLGPEAPPMEQGTRPLSLFRVSSASSRRRIVQGEVDLMKALFRPQTVEDMMETPGLSI